MGNHDCLYYQSQEDLCSVVTGFLKTGLRKNELCVWVVPESLEIETAKAFLRETLADLDWYLEKGQLEILRPQDWYTPSGTFDAGEVLDRWAQKEREALARGFSAVCAIGDGSWFPSEDRGKLMAYESSAQAVLGKSKLSALCTYTSKKFSEEEIKILSAHHDATLCNFHGALDLFRK